MPNVIKYSAVAETSALKKSNYWLGVGDVDKGPTSSTSYYNGYTPPAGGYTVYLNKAANGPAVYVASNDSELITITANVSGTTYGSAALALQYYQGQVDKMAVDRDYETIQTTDLVWAVDAGFPPSYPRTGTSVTDMGKGVVAQNLTNGPAFAQGGNGNSYWQFDGTNDFLTTSAYNAAFNTNGTQAFTAEVWAYPVSGNTTGYYPIFSRYSSVTGGNHGWGINWTQNSINASAGNAFLYCERLGGTGNSANANEQIPTGSFFNNWHQMVMVYDGANMMFYRNGSLKMTSACTYTITNTSALVQLAARPNTAAPNVFSAVRVNNARLYTRALSTAEVLSNFNALRGRFGI